MIKTPLTWIANAIRTIMSPFKLKRTPETLARGKRPIQDDADPLGGDPAEGYNDGFNDAGGSDGEGGDGDGNGS